MFLRMREFLLVSLIFAVHGALLSLAVYVKLPGSPGQLPTCYWVSTNLSAPWVHIPPNPYSDPCGLRQLLLPRPLDDSVAATPLYNYHPLPLHQAAHGKPSRLPHHQQGQLYHNARANIPPPHYYHTPRPLAPHPYGPLEHRHVTPPHNVYGRFPARYQVPRHPQHLPPRHLPPRHLPIPEYRGQVGRPDPRDAHGYVTHRPQPQPHRPHPYLPQPHRPHSYLQQPHRPHPYRPHAQPRHRPHGSPHKGPPRHDPSFIYRSKMPPLKGPTDRYGRRLPHGGDYNEPLDLRHDYLDLPFLASYSDFHLNRNPDPHHQHPYQEDPYKQDPYKQDPYRQDPYQQDPYHQDPYKEDPYKQDPYHEDPYKQDPYHQDPYKEDPYKQDPYHQDPYKEDPYKQDPYKEDPPYHEVPYGDDYDYDSDYESSEEMTSEEIVSDEPCESCTLDDDE